MKKKSISKVNCFDGELSELNKCLKTENIRYKNLIFNRIDLFMLHVFLSFRNKSASFIDQYRLTVRLNSIPFPIGASQVSFGGYEAHGQESIFFALDNFLKSIPEKTLKKNIVFFNLKGKNNVYAKSKETAHNFTNIHWNSKSKNKSIDRILFLPLCCRMICLRSVRIWFWLCAFLYGYQVYNGDLKQRNLKIFITILYSYISNKPGMIQVGASHKDQNIHGDLCLREIVIYPTKIVKILFSSETFCQSAKILVDSLLQNEQLGKVSYQHEENMRYLHISKLTVCFICMKPLSLMRS